MSHAVTAAPRRRGRSRISDLFFARPKLLTLVLLLPPLLWLGVVYVGSLFALLLQSFFSIDDFSGLIVREFTLTTYARAAPAGQSRHHRPHGADGGAGDARLRDRSPSRSPTTRRAMPAAGGKALFYLAVMLPLWSSYLVQVYAWKLILAKEGILTWRRQGPASDVAARRLLALPVIGGPSLSISYIGTFLVFVYLWLPLHDPADPGGARARARQL